MNQPPDQDKIQTAHLEPMSLSDALDEVKAVLGSRQYVTIIGEIERLKSENKRLTQENETLRNQTQEYIRHVLGNFAK